jgi:hypothetical protein
VRERYSSFERSDMAGGEGRREPGNVLFAQIEPSIVIFNNNVLNVSDKPAAVNEFALKEHCRGTGDAAIAGAIDAH